MNDSLRQNSGKSQPVPRAMQLLFIVWLFFVNFFYYLQFRDVILARLAAWIHR
jgi:hypothetical protein